jgi:hypothetical protein
MLFFDAYIFIDWSSRNRIGPDNPCSDAVWEGKYTRESRNLIETYYRTRRECIDSVRSSLSSYVTKGYRVLLGFDFPYGYPKGLAQCLGLSDDYPPWQNVWTAISSQVTDSKKNKSNRFMAASKLNTLVGYSEAGPFWGVPKTQETIFLQTKSPEFPFISRNGVVIDRLRIVELHLRGVQESWKLFGAGSVGSQALTGIPYVRKLRFDPSFSEKSAVWPFETSFTPTPTPKVGPFILHAEIWPGVVKSSVNQILMRDKTIIKDQAQVRAMCLWASELDERAEFGQLFDTPEGLDATDIDSCINHEGWVLGAI